MTLYKISAEHVSQDSVGEIRQFCREQMIRVTKIKMDDLFSNYIHIRVAGDTRRVATNVRDFIWENINGGAYCDIQRIKTTKTGEAR